MPLHDRVRARRVDEGDVAEELDGIRLLDDVVGDALRRRLFRVTEDGDHVVDGDRAFDAQLRAEQRVDQ
jgi:hypothetical protein